MFKQIGSYTTTLTRHFAEEVATLPSWKGERPLKQSRVDFLRKKLDGGEFFSPEWTFATLDGAKYRVNGQHSAVMLSQAPASALAGMTVMVREFQCDTERDLADLFSQFDRPESARSYGDMIRSHKVADSDLSGVPDIVLQVILSGVYSYKMLNGDTDPSEAKRFTRDERANLMYSEKPFIHWMTASELLADRRFYKAAVIAGIYATYKADPEAALAFWRLVASEAHPSPDDPTRVLSRLLTEAKQRKEGIRGQGGKARALSIKGLYSKIVSAWNASRQERTLAKLQYKPAGRLPKAI